MADDDKSGAATAPASGAKAAAAVKEPAPAKEAPVAKHETEEVVYEPPTVTVDQTEPKPTWSRYGNQEAASTGRALSAAADSRSMQEEVDAPFYTFGGHRDKNNLTELLNTRVGQVKVGGNIKLPDEELKRLTSLGFLFNRVK